VPFEHESLLIDQQEELDESEKELAMRGKYGSVLLTCCTALSVGRV